MCTDGPISYSKLCERDGLVSRPVTFFYHWVKLNRFDSNLHMNCFYCAIYTGLCRPTPSLFLTPSQCTISPLFCNMDSGLPVDGSDGEAEASITNPSSLYTLEDYLVQMDMLDSFAKEIAMEVKESLDAQGRSSRSGPRIYVNRPREEAAEQLVRDYFCDDPTYKKKVFRRRFRMRRPLFERIVHALGEWSP